MSKINRTTSHILGQARKHPECEDGSLKLVNRCPVEESGVHQLSLNKQTGLDYGTLWPLISLCHSRGLLNEKNAIVATLNGSLSKVRKGIAYYSSPLKHDDKLQPNS